MLGRQSGIALHPLQVEMSTSSRIVMAQIFTLERKNMKTWQRAIVGEANWFFQQLLKSLPHALVQPVQAFA